MLVQKQVGPVPSSTSLAAGFLTPGRAGNMGEDIVSELHGRYYEGTYRRARFGGAMQGVNATATIAGVGTSITGALVLYNPPSSSVNVVIEKFGVGFVLAPAAPLVYGLATGYSATALSGTLTSVTPKCKYLGAGAPTPTAGLVISSGVTLPTAATVDTVFGQVDTGAVTTVTTISDLFDLEGSIILGPGGYCHFWTSAVLLASAHIASFQWEEVPI